MSKNVSEILKEANKGILTEDTLKEIQNLFEGAVDEKVKIHVEKALIEQDPHHKNLPALVLHNEKWHPGLVGIVASRIAERYQSHFRVAAFLSDGNGDSRSGIARSHCAVARVMGRHIVRPSRQHQS